MVKGVDAIMLYSSLDSDKQDLIGRYLDLLLEKNKELNLTAIRDRDEGLVLHIEDSLAALSSFDEAPEGRYADIGTGGGVPGIPLAIASGRSTVLVDSSKKKMRAVSEIISSLGLEGQIETKALRIEELALSDFQKFSVITARALTSMSSLLELTSPLLCKGGLLIAMKGIPSDDELKSAEKVEKLVGMKFIGDDEFKLSNGAVRHLLKYRKAGQPRIKLPRKNGMAQNKPLG
jgi:16S rRNA (guanine527-N7)-methyltransferase